MLLMYKSAPSSFTLSGSDSVDLGRLLSKSQGSSERGLEGFAHAAVVSRPVATSMPAQQGLMNKGTQPGFGSCLHEVGTRISCQKLMLKIV